MSQLSAQDQHQRPAKNPAITWVMLLMMVVTWLGLLGLSHVKVSGWLIIFLLAAIWVIWLLWWRYANDMTSVAMVWLVAICLRLFGLCSQPIFENDWIRYLFDGVMFVQQGSPYDIIPLDFIADPKLNEQFGSQLDDFGYPELPTIYGPVAMSIFGLSAWIAPANLWVLKSVTGLIELLGLCVARRWLGDAIWKVYALCPLLLFEVWTNLHIDGVAITLAISAVYILQRVTCSQRKVFYGGLCLGLAVACRLQALPLVILLIWWYRSPKLASWASLTALMCYLPFWLNGSPAGLDISQKFVSIWYYNALLLKPLTWFMDANWARYSLLVLSGCLVVYWAWKGPLRSSFRDGQLGKPATPAADILYAALLLAGPVLNPWYCLWMLPFALARGERWTIAFIISASMGYANSGNLGLFDGNIYRTPFDHHWTLLVGQWMILGIGIYLSIMTPKTDDTPTINPS